jgi:putative nucleotidyltransferase with HDIG domain
MDETRIDVVVRGFGDLIERRGDGDPRNPLGAERSLPSEGEWGDGCAPWRDGSTPCLSDSIVFKDMSLNPMVSPAKRALRDARDDERAGRLGTAIDKYQAAIDMAIATGDAPTQSEALRRLSVAMHRQLERGVARELCTQSFGVADDIGDQALAAEALNTLGGFELEAGQTGTAGDLFHRALAMARDNPALIGRIEQNLGIIANIRGDLGAALLHYENSLAASTLARDDSGCAIAYHNLGMISADQHEWERAEHYFDSSLALADSLGDVRMRGLCLLNRSEVFIARQRFEDARLSAEDALRLFDELDARAQKADAYKFLGVVYRETGRPVLAEARLTSAIALAAECGSALGEAEASRELARLHQLMGRNQEALRLLNAARALFVHLDARGDLSDVTSKAAELERTYLAIVRDWGQSIESADSYTYGHCERVATYAVAVARALGLDAARQTTVQVGAYLHDVGKVRIPHEILNKPGKLTREERELMELHTIYGLELLEGVDFPWDIKPLIRWHHEKCDGSGYPDRLRGEAIPLEAQIIGIVDVYDALTSTRSYRAAMPADAAVEELRRCRAWWRDDIVEAALEYISVHSAGIAT